MFGYLKINKTSPEKIRNYYKYSYCSLCKALATNYGFIGRCSLSFDVTLFSLFVVSPETFEKFAKIHCLNKKTGTEKLSIYSKLSSLNLFLLREKIKDNIIDEKSFKYKCINLLFKRKIKKAELNEPELSHVIEKAFDEYYIKEKDACSINEVAAFFGEAMIKIGSFFGISDNLLTNLFEISKWVYLIDAIDDFEKDVKNNQFNLFKTLIYEDYCSDQKIEVFKKKYLEVYNPRFELFNKGRINELAILEIAKRSIPETTFKIIKKKRYV